MTGTRDSVRPCTSTTKPTSNRAQRPSPRPNLDDRTQASCHRLRSQSPSRAAARPSQPLQASRSSPPHRRGRGRFGAPRRGRCCPIPVVLGRALSCFGMARFADERKCQQAWRSRYLTADRTGRKGRRGVSCLCSAGALRKSPPRRRRGLPDVVADCCSPLSMREWAPSMAPSWVILVRSWRRLAVALASVSRPIQRIAQHSRFPDRP